MNLKNESATSQLPESMEQAWRRLENRGGSPSDLRIVLEYVARNCSFEADVDHRVFDSWLSAQGVSRRSLPDLVLEDYRRRFDVAQEALRNQTRSLLEGLTNGPYLVQFLESLGTFRTAFKRFAFRVMGRAAPAESTVFVYAFLSLEAPEFAREVGKTLPTSTVHRLFYQFAAEAGRQAKLG